MKKIVMRMDRKTGVITTLYTEAIDLLRLGRLQVSRASHVEFDNARGGWTVELEPGVLGAPLAGSVLARTDDGLFYASLMKSRAHVFATRQDALDAEVIYLQRRLKEGDIWLSG